MSWSPGAAPPSSSPAAELALAVQQVRGGLRVELLPAHQLAGVRKPRGAGVHRLEGPPRAREAREGGGPP
eukprot:CAMPEP_0118937734 /NCGR_PEP_ID=MMETSP1169-20130426/23627_1 /TAXON_ID=36882 /ORGANISM="Pyramimonas obovata, Strain CCMP722" /LENGTH=69 /DNA_ID=CAMNT_0006881461 /DNA_START=257 /DNA_END=464 /DNA_ORIENTATION=+